MAPPARRARHGARGRTRARPPPRGIRSEIQISPARYISPQRDEDLLTHAWQSRPYLGRISAVSAQALLTPIFGLAVPLWGTAMLEAWRLQQKALEITLRSRRDHAEIMTRSRRDHAEITPRLRRDHAMHARLSTVCRSSPRYGRSRTSTRLTCYGLNSGASASSLGLQVTNCFESWPNYYETWPN